jgi:dTDP-4-amino-4,6-dideoxygalactose transaminase
MTSDEETIPFNRPYLTGRELSFIAEAHQHGQLSGDGIFTKRCQGWLEKLGENTSALLTHSCTAALEMSAILANIQPGDEVIMPSYTFVSTANAFVLRGAVPVFVDIRFDTLNINEKLIEKEITKKTKAIVVVHYAGVACEMDYIMGLAKSYGLLVIEDAAQACMSSYKGRMLGTIGHIGCFSFHETKNIISGEGGAILINCENLLDRAEIIREKGTNRKKFIQGLTDKYTWTDIGSSYLPGEIVAAFLWAQMQEAAFITQKRKDIWNYYKQNLEVLNPNFISGNILPECSHNAHMFYLINKSERSRATILKILKDREINCVFHYVPLHTSPFGKRVSKREYFLPITDYVSANLIRLPMWVGLTHAQQNRLIQVLLNDFNNAMKTKNPELAEITY